MQWGGFAVHIWTTTAVLVYACGAEAVNQKRPWWCGSGSSGIGWYMIGNGALLLTSDATRDCSHARDPGSPLLLLLDVLREALGDLDLLLRAVVQQMLRRNRIHP